MLQLILNVINLCFYIEMCPKGDDPLTVNQIDRSYRINVQAPNTLTGYLGIRFQGEIMYLNLNSPSSTDCINVFNSNPKFGSVSCIFTKLSTNHYQYNVTILSWPLFPRENNLYSHYGNPSPLAFFCDVNRATAGTTCNFFDIDASNIKGEINLFYCIDLL